MDYLRRLAVRIREARAQRGMTRAALAKDSGVSLRFLAQLEAGDGNPSLIVLQRIATAMGFAVETLVSDRADRPIGEELLLQSLRRLGDYDLGIARRWLAERFGSTPTVARNRYIALIGLRGAGKSTLGRRLSAQREVPFFELDREVEREYGATIGEILQLHGQPGYRRFERQSLHAILAAHGAAVIETGGGLAADAETLDLLLGSTLTVWISASPEEHMQRVLAQGDRRPMAHNREAMSELKDILKAREPYYREAELHLDTSGQTPEQSFAALLTLLSAPRQ
jgi:XRE family transcriptional regulator, aerobic/anaerobic benzoate catabolism transcriptional regulator